MPEKEPSDKHDDPQTPDPLESDRWRDDARQWYLELKQEESTIAPWLSLEWTGEWMRIR